MGKTKNKIKVDKKELIVTIVVLVAAIVLGFFLGKALYKNIMYLQEKDIDKKRVVLTKLPKDKIRWN